MSVLVQRTRANGVVRGSLDGKLRLDFVDKAKMPVRGDVLVTSGLGGVYPKGIVVGEVTDVSSPQADLYPEVRGRLARRHRPHRGGRSCSSARQSRHAAGRRRVNRLLPTAIALVAAAILQVALAPAPGDLRRRAERPVPRGRDARPGRGAGRRVRGGLRRGAAVRPARHPASSVPTRSCCAWSATSPGCCRRTCSPRGGCCR